MILVNPPMITGDPTPPRLLPRSLRQLTLTQTHHFDDLWVRRLGEHRPGGRDVVDEFVETGALDLLALEVGDRVHEVEYHAALLELLDEQVLLFRGGRVWNGEYRGQAAIFIHRSGGHLYILYCISRPSLYRGQAAIFIRHSCHKT